ncbi:tRNA-uridine aminocarboxypropyltransferase [Paraglaciecola sp. L1A13]|uniref:tRNA-uridine aminocarboxypropyltransferase n=1 Tax=Paraglaciecola sp. L1A13 TaxID=2686359 RepID=UPI00131A9CA4|nr:tRNA-uridine aminocarboxypropyltransferase [Paraglaciecola sp. L1A13]
MSRVICTHCDYPQSVCMCNLLCTVTSTQEVIILQHPSEVNHAKSSVKLIRLCVPNSQIWVGETAHDFCQLIDDLKEQKRKACVVYPSQNSIPLESIDNRERRNVDTLILLDATWRKAYKMWQLNPWLHDLPAWNFAEPPKGKYQIRNTTVESGLSTLEALAQTLYLTQGIDKTPLLETFMGMQARVFARHLSNQLSQDQ